MVLYCAVLWYIIVRILFNIMFFTCCISWCFFCDCTTHYDFFYEIISNTGLRFSEIDQTIFDGLIVCKHTHPILHQISKHKNKSHEKNHLSFRSSLLTAYVISNSVYVPCIRKSNRSKHVLHVHLICSISFR
jgi:hypothetical protein